MRQHRAHHVFHRIVGLLRQRRVGERLQRGHVRRERGGCPVRNRRGVGTRPTVRRGVPPSMQVDPFQHPQTHNRPRVTLLVQPGQQFLIVAGGTHRRHLDRHAERLSLDVEPIELLHQTHDTLSEHSLRRPRRPGNQPRLKRDKVGDEQRVLRQPQPERACRPLTHRSQESVSSRGVPLRQLQQRGHRHATTIKDVLRSPVGYCVLRTTVGYCVGPAPRSATGWTCGR